MIAQVSKAAGFKLVLGGAGCPVSPKSGLAVCYASHLKWKLWRLSQNFSFWESNLRFRGKSGLLAAFSKAIPKTNRVLGMA
ncbi:MAG: hypothetical protein LBD96_02215, partial [Treponema sp.]|nr:hypothetical protein [Treponema sp.]